MLKNLLSKKSLTILGLNSGTSVDGMDLALIRFGLSGKKPKVSFMGGTMIPYSASVKTEMESLIRDNKKSVEDTTRRDIAYGRLLGRKAAGFIAKGKHRVDLVASHGQTVGHYPDKKSNLRIRTGATVQIGDGNAIAFETGLPVVSDFRMADVASGGEGAPLTPFANQLLFGDTKRSRIIVNIGGIANYSYHRAGGKQGDIRGGDCGPGNILSDLACKLLLGKKYDAGGQIAFKGQPRQKITALVERANQRRGISAGREQFGDRLLARIIHAAGGPAADRADIITSIMESTARLIYKSIDRYLGDDRLEGLYLTGGGRKNQYLVKRLEELIDPVKVWPIEVLGFDGDLLEAVSFAVMGGCFVREVSSAVSQITGAAPGIVAGKLSLPPIK